MPTQPRAHPVWHRRCVEALSQGLGERVLIAWRGIEDVAVQSDYQGRITAQGPRGIDLRLQPSAGDVDPVHLTAPSVDRVGCRGCASRKENAAENERAASTRTSSTLHAAIIRRTQAAVPSNATFQPSS